MAYDVTLAQINTSIGGLSNGSGFNGFPGNSTPPFQNFRYLLYSHWVCGAPAFGDYPSIGPAFVPFLGLGSTGIDLHGYDTTTGDPTTTTQFYTASFDHALLQGVRSHMLLSVDTLNKITQFYINDAAPMLTGPLWSSGGPYYFNLNYGFGNWNWDVTGVNTSGNYPGIGDVWCTSPASFVDLSVTANRRKFINADLSPVDLGNTGANPFGTSPAIYLSIRPGGVATDILINRGAGNPTVTAAGDPPSFQAPGTCTLALRPASLAMDTLACSGPVVRPPGDLIWLSWSDDRGHTFGNPVSQPFGDRGDYLTSLQWQRLGMARDRVFCISWSAPIKTAIQGAWIEVDTSAKT